MERFWTQPRKLGRSNSASILQSASLFLLADQVHAQGISWSDCTETGNMLVLQAYKWMGEEASIPKTEVVTIIHSNKSDFLSLKIYFQVEKRSKMNNQLFLQGIRLICYYIVFPFPLCVEMFLLCAQNKCACIITAPIWVLPPCAC